MNPREIDERIRNRTRSEPSPEATAQVLAHAACRSAQLNRPSKPSRRRPRWPAWTVAAVVSCIVIAFWGVFHFASNEPRPRDASSKAPVVAQARITDAAVASRLASTKHRLKALREFDYGLSTIKRPSCAKPVGLDSRLKRIRSKASVASAWADWPDDS